MFLKWRSELGVPLTFVLLYIKWFNCLHPCRATLTHKLALNSAGTQTEYNNAIDKIESL